MSPVKELKWNTGIADLRLLSQIEASTIAIGSCGFASLTVSNSLEFGTRMCTCAQDAKSAAVVLRGRRSATNEKSGGFSPPSWFDFLFNFTICADIVRSAPGQWLHTAFQLASGSKSGGS